MERTPPGHTATSRHTSAADGGGDALPPGTAVHPLQQLPVQLEPDPSLLRYYILSALMFGPGFFFAVFPFYFRYRTLRYEVDEEGITMRWGILFRREVSLTYARIQDIQLSSNVVERWLGLAKIQLQTASGSASAEMTIEGLRDVDTMRDFLYARMRGARDHATQAHTQAPRSGAAGATALRGAGSTANPLESAGASDAALGELAATLDAVADEIRGLRRELTGRRGEASRAHDA